LFLLWLPCARSLHMSSERRNLSNLSHLTWSKIVKQRVTYNFECRALCNLPWWACVSSHQVQCNIPILRPYCEKICTTFLNDAEILTTCGFVFWCSQIFYIRPYCLNIATAFYIMTECSDVAVFFSVWGCVHATILPYFTWPWPGLDSVFYFGCSVYQV